MRAAAWSKLFQPVHNRGGSLAYTEQTIMETELTNKKPGSTIDSWCGKCKLVLAHTIEAMVGDKPVRVHCNTCKSQHSYKPNPPGATPRRSQPREPGNGPAPPPAKVRSSRYQSLLKAKNTAGAKPYSPKDKYEAGDVLEHPTFGRGIATAVKDGTKIEVLFESGPKTLVQGR